MADWYSLAELKRDLQQMTAAELNAVITCWWVRDPEQVRSAVRAVREGGRP